MRLFSYFFAVGILLLGVQGCNGGSSTPRTTPTPTPPPARVAGNYTGSNVDSVQGRGIVSANIVQAGSKLAGGWSFSYPDNPSIVTSFAGSVTASAVALSVPAELGVPCSYSVMGTASGKQISGSYSSSNCGDSGTFMISRP